MEHLSTANQILDMTTSNPASKRPLVRETHGKTNDSGKDDECKSPSTKKPRNTPITTFPEKLLQQQQQQEEENQVMSQSPTGRALLLVKRLIQEHQSLLQSQYESHPVTLVGHDDLVFLAEKFVECYDHFRITARPHHVTLAYHYTKQRHLPSIRYGGLLSHPERQSQNISTKHGAYFGEGIYVGNNPYSFQSTGDTGLLVAIIKGRELAVERGGSLGSNVDTFVGNKQGPGNLATMEIVLQRSCQVLPILQYPSHMVQRHGGLYHNGNVFLSFCQSIVQDVLDEFFNNNATTPFVLQNETIQYCAPTSLIPTAPCTRRISTLTRSENCSICLDNLRKRGKVLQLKHCGHLFHADCITISLQHDCRCPTCRKLASEEPQGKSPSGTMIIESTPYSCGGHEHGSNGSIRIQYRLPSGRQLSYHESPGLCYSGTDRTAYLPNNLEGRKLLVRLKYAWSRGLLFTIGTSMTTKKSGQIVWSSVHQKTSLQGGVHGWPDPNYFSNVNAELDNLDVPSCEDILSSRARGMSGGTNAATP